METRPQGMNAPKDVPCGDGRQTTFFIFLFTQPALFLQGRKGSEKTSLPFSFKKYLQQRR
jgi:hypothetical protein